MLTSCPPDAAAVANMLTGMICAHRPWFGPELICPQFALSGPVHPDAGVTEYSMKLTPVMTGGAFPTAQI
jgi:hypothetical protein